MTRIGLLLRLKLMLRELYTDDFWSRFKVPYSQDEEFMVQHKEECDALIGQIPEQYRQYFITFLENKQKFLIRSISSSYDRRKNDLTRARLFQATLIKKQIMDVTSDEKQEIANRERRARLRSIYKKKD